tara:strand:- start:2319 stop:2930 length:612 start_codon:yes stop_codon:yes gene_type:complete
MVHPLSAALSGVGLFLLAAHVGAALAGEAGGGGVPQHAFWPGALACAGLSYGLALPRGPWRDLWGSGVEAVLVTVPLAWWARTLDVYALAYVSTAFVLWWIDVAFARGVVTYGPHVRGFVVTRSVLYASLRATSAACVRHAGLAPRVARLVPLLVSSLETGGMVAVGHASYTFGAHTSTFAVYALLKASLFVALPLVEEALLR